MKKVLYYVAAYASVILMLFTFAFANEAAIKEGDIAPDFKLESSEGKVVSLKDFKGKKVVLYFYPKDNTSG